MYSGAYEQILQTNTDGVVLALELDGHTGWATRRSEFHECCEIRVTNVSPKFVGNLPID